MNRLLISTALALAVAPLRADDFFESKIRPVLVEHCYRCHSDQAKAPKGGLRLDSRAALVKGGDSGPAIVVKEPAKSKLMEAIRYANADLQMPPKGKLPDAVIKDFEKWITDGAAWPGDEKKPEVKPSEFDLAKRKAEHWAWQPVKPQTPPRVRNVYWTRDPVDRFILAKLEEKKIVPASEAPKSVWLRRVSFAITGLPPTPAEIADFEMDQSSKAYEKVVDRLLASPHYGERWGRHWLDLVRYAESRGHEFDFEHPNIWLYRDYVIRAFNDDLPYDQFAFEQIAGTTKNGERFSRDKATNESMIGTAFWRFGEEVQSPVDIRQDFADRFDNRIDVFSKTFLGLTVACARCHDHKFDAISTKDYYALLGLLKAGVDAPLRIDGDCIQKGGVNYEMALDRNDELRRAVRKVDDRREDYEKHSAWLKTVNVVSDYTRRSNRERSDQGTIDFTMRYCDAGVVSLRVTDGVRKLHREERGAFVFDRFWEKLTAAGGMLKEPGKLGEVPRAGFTLRSPAFKLECDNVYLLVRGGGFSYAAIGGHTVINGPLHGSLLEPFKNDPHYRWVKHPLKNYKGQTFRMEVTANPKTDFAIAMIVQGDEAPSMPPAMAIPSFKDDELNEKEILAKLEAKLDGLDRKPVWESRLVPGVWDHIASGEVVFVRGNHRTPGEPVPPRFLEAFGEPQIKLKRDEVFGDYDRLARQVTDPTCNPYFSRVMVNRVWHHLFGRGIVASTDNFGVLGERPTHPELLDYLATEFQKDFRLKPLIKRLVLSSTYRMNSATENHANDPANLLLHHFRIKRLEGEAIRDSILQVSGRLDRTLYGPPVPMHLTPFMDGRGRPKESGPRDGEGRRSIYLAVRRNFLSPFLLAFDFPNPFSTVGTRTVSNVPAQALILMNDPFVHEQAKKWGAAMAAMSGSVDEKIAWMYSQAFARPPSEKELAACREFVNGKPQAWVELAHSLMNVKEFRFVP